MVEIKSVDVAKSKKKTAKSQWSRVFFDLLVADHFKVSFISRSVLGPQTVKVKRSKDRGVEKELTELSVKSWNRCRVAQLSVCSPSGTRGCCRLHVLVFMSGLLKG